MTEEDAKKLFSFLDYNEARIVSKHQIRLLISYQKNVNGDENQPNEILRRLARMLTVPDLKVFDENLFCFFYLSK